MVTGRDAAPGRLELVRSFVNTLDVEDAVDGLAEPAALGAWLEERGLMSAGSHLSLGEHARALALREALRALLLANNGGELAFTAAETIDVAARRGGLQVRFGADGACFVPAADGLDGALGQLLGIVAGSMVDGTWARLKACRSDSCRWAFYDRA